MTNDLGESTLDGNLGKMDVCYASLEASNASKTGVGSEGVASYLMNYSLQAL